MSKELNTSSVIDQTPKHLLSILVLLILVVLAVLLIKQLLLSIKQYY